MVRINQQPEAPLSPIQFFVNRRCADREIQGLRIGSIAQLLPFKTGLYPSWYVKVGYDGYLRESGEVF
jgi:hypothetical protein